MADILVTGGGGFTGSSLVDRLLKRGHNVAALVHVNKGFSDEIRKNGAKVVFGDIRDKKKVDGVMKNTDIVFHIASAFQDYAAPKRYYWDVNVKGTKILLEAALKHKVKKFVHCSTCGVHGDVKEIPANENSPLNPQDYYQYTKLQGEISAREFFKKNNLPGIVIRPSGIYGPRDLRFVRLFRAIRKKRFIMLGGGNVYYHLCYIDNLVDAFELAINKEKAIGNTYLIADDNYVTLNRLVGEIAKTLDVPEPKFKVPVWPVWLAGLGCEMVCKPFGINPPLFRRRVAFFVNNRAFDISKAKKELGYGPKIGFSEGIRRTAEWYKKHNWI